MLLYMLQSYISRRELRIANFKRPTRVRLIRFTLSGKVQAVLGKALDILTLPTF